MSSSKECILRKPIEIWQDERFLDMRVYDSGVRRKTKFGKNTIVWTTTPQGSLL